MLAVLRGARLHARLVAPLVAPRAGARALSLERGDAGATAAPPRVELSSGNYLWGISDEQIAELGESVRRAVSLENASSSDRMKVELHRAIEHWQARPGDTGSPAVQSARSALPARALDAGRPSVR